MIPIKIKKQGICVISVLTLALILSPASLYARYSVSCKTAIFSDSTKVKRLYGKGVHTRVLPASTVKVMTALVVMEQLDLDQWVRVSHNATLPQPSKLYLRKGERYKVRDLLKAILLKSANDAAVVLAEAVSGTHWEFAQLMNKRARQIGAKHTRFANANGLPSKAKQYTTAYDMYLIFRRAIRHPFFRDVIKMKYATIHSSGGRKLSFKSHNKMLFFDWKTRPYGKTGYTRAAGKCFTGTLQKGNSTLIMAVFNCRNRWQDIKYLISGYARMAI